MKDELDGNDLVPYTTPNGVKIRKYADAALNAVKLMPYQRGRLVLMFNIALRADVKNRIFNGKNFMNELKRDLPQVYLFTLGYFGGHDFDLDLNR